MFGYNNDKRFAQAYTSVALAFACCYTSKKENPLLEFLRIQQQITCLTRGKTLQISKQTFIFSGKPIIIGGNRSFRESRRPFSCLSCANEVHLPRFLATVVLVRILLRMKLPNAKCTKLNFIIMILNVCSAKEKENCWLFFSVG